MSYLAFTACDEKYFYAHGPAYMQSCIETGTKFEIVVVDASSSKAEDMRSYVESERFGRVCVIERAENAPPMDRVGYACARLCATSSIESFIARMDSFVWMELGRDSRLWLMMIPSGTWRGSSRGVGGRTWNWTTWSAPARSA